METALTSFLVNKTSTIYFKNLFLQNLDSESSIKTISLSDVRFKKFRGKIFITAEIEEDITYRLRKIQGLVLNCVFADPDNPKAEIYHAKKTSIRDISAMPPITLILEIEGIVPLLKMPQETRSVASIDQAKIKEQVAQDPASLVLSTDPLIAAIGSDQLD